jgi:hypothetical protein
MPKSRSAGPSGRPGGGHGWQSLDLIRSIKAVSAVDAEKLIAGHQAGWLQFLGAQYLADAKAFETSTRNHHSAQAKMRLSDPSDSRVHRPRESRFYEGEY